MLFCGDLGLPQISTKSGIFFSRPWKSQEILYLVWDILKNVT